MAAANPWEPGFSIPASASAPATLNPWDSGFVPEAPRGNALIGAGPAPDSRGEFSKGVASGLDTLAADGAGFLALLGASVGHDGVRDWGLNKYQEITEQSARANAPKVASYRDIDSASDFLDYSANLVGQTLPFSISTVFGGGLGGIITKAIAPKLIARGIGEALVKKSVEKILADKTKKVVLAEAMKQARAQATKTLATRGALAGSMVAGAPIQQGELFQHLTSVGVEDTPAALASWGLGFVQASLDVAPEAFLAHLVLNPKRVEKELAKSIARGVAGKPEPSRLARFGKNVGAGTLLEGATEGSQEAIKYVAEALTNPDFKWDTEEKEAVAENAVAGALIGLLLGTGGASLHELLARSEEEKKNAKPKTASTTSSAGGVVPPANTSPPATGGGGAQVVPPAAGQTQSPSGGQAEPVLSGADGSLVVGGAASAVGSPTELAEIGGAAKAIGENLRSQLWAAYQSGATTMSGVRDPILAAAKNAGVPVDEAAFYAFMEQYGKGETAPPLVTTPPGATTAAPADTSGGDPNAQHQRGSLLERGRQGASPAMLAAQEQAAAAAAASGQTGSLLDRAHGRATPSTNPTQVSSQSTVTDAPSAQPLSFYASEFKDARNPETPRRGVYVPVADVEQHKLQRLIAMAHGEKDEKNPLVGRPNADGKHGVLFASSADLKEFERRRSAGEDPNALIGEFTGASAASPTATKPQTATPTVVQRRDETGAPVQETVATPDTTQQVAETMSTQGPGEIVVTTPEAALATRAAGVAAEGQAATAPAASTDVVPATSGAVAEQAISPMPWLGKNLAEFRAWLATDPEFLGDIEAVEDEDQRIALTLEFGQFIDWLQHGNAGGKKPARHYRKAYTEYKTAREKDADRLAMLPMPVEFGVQNTDVEGASDDLPSQIDPPTPEETTGATAVLSEVSRVYGLRGVFNNVLQALFTTQRALLPKIFERLQRGDSVSELTAEVLGTLFGDRAISDYQKRAGERAEAGEPEGLAEEVEVEDGFGEVDTRDPSKIKIVGQDGDIEGVKRPLSKKERNDGKPLYWHAKPWAVTERVGADAMLVKLRLRDPSTAWSVVLLTEAEARARLLEMPPHGAGWYVLGEPRSSVEFRYSKIYDSVVSEGQAVLIALRDGRHRFDKIYSQKMKNHPTLAYGLPIVTDGKKDLLAVRDVVELGFFLSPTLRETARSDRGLALMYALYTGMSALNTAGAFGGRNRFPTISAHTVLEHKPGHRPITMAKVLADSMYTKEEIAAVADQAEAEFLSRNPRASKADREKAIKRVKDKWFAAEHPKRFARAVAQAQQLINAGLATTGNARRDADIRKISNRRAMRQEHARRLRERAQRLGDPRMENAEEMGDNVVDSGDQTLGDQIRNASVDTEEGIAQRAAYPESIAPSGHRENMVPLGERTLTPFEERRGGSRPGALGSTLGTVAPGASGSTALDRSWRDPRARNIGAMGVVDEALLSRTAPQPMRQVSSTEDGDTGSRWSEEEIAGFNRAAFIGEVKRALWQHDNVPDGLAVWLVDNLGRDALRATHPDNIAETLAAFREGRMPDIGRDEIPLTPQTAPARSNGVETDMADTTHAATIQRIAESIRGILKIRHVLVIVDSPAAAARAAGRFGIDPRHARESASDRGQAGTAVYGVGGTIIYLNPRATGPQLAKTLAHEIGHVFFNQYWRTANTTMRQAVEKEHRAFLKTPAGAAMHAKRLSRNPEGDGYNISEYISDQVAVYVNTDKEAASETAKWYKQLALNLLKVVEWLKNEGFTEGVQAASFIRSVIAPGSAPQATTNQETKTVPAAASRPQGWARYSPNGYEVSTQGDRRFSALNARLKDGRTIEEAYQLDVKGYRKQGNDWRLGKGKPPLDKSVNTWEAYLDLWRQWARENPELIEDLRQKSAGKTLTDKFATTPISQARALATILSETAPAAPAAPAPSATTTTVQARGAGYAPRTRHNAAAGDLTVALASDYNTAGERLTKSAAGSKYLAIPLATDAAQAGATLAAEMKKRGAKVLNVAGNSLHTLSKKLDMAQGAVDRHLYEVLKAAHAIYPIQKIISGGQTGVDIASSIAARALGIPTEVTMPLGFPQRLADGTDVRRTKQEIEQQIADGAAALGAQSSPPWEDDIASDFDEPHHAPLKDTIVRWLEANNVVIQEGDLAMDIPAKIATIPPTASTTEAVARMGADVAAVLAMEHPAVRKLGDQIRATEAFRLAVGRFVREGFSVSGSARTKAVREVLTDLIEYGLLSKHAPTGQRTAELAARYAELDALYGADLTLVERVVQAVKAAITALMRKARNEPALLQLGKKLAADMEAGRPMLPGAVKPGTQAVEFADALRRNPGGKRIVDMLAGGRDTRFALVGSLANAAQGTIYRDPNVMLHDIDMIFSGTKDEAQATMSRLFPEATKIYSFTSGSDEYAQTYLIPPEGMKIKDLRRRGNLVAAYDVVDEAGQTMGSYRNENGVETYTGVRAYPTDVFTDGAISSQFDRIVQYKAGGVTYRLGNYADAMKKKVDYARWKDTRDYAAFRPNSVHPSFESLGFQDDVFSDMNVEPAEPAPNTPQDWFRKQWQALKVKYPTPTRWAENVGSVILSAHEVFVARLFKRIERMEIPIYTGMLRMFYAGVGKNLTDSKLGAADYEKDVSGYLNRFIGEHHATLKGLDQLQQHQVLRLMLGLPVSANADPKVYDAAVKIRKTLDEAYAYAEKAGLPLNKLEDYFPIQWDPEQFQQPEVIEEILEALNAKGVIHPVSKQPYTVKQLEHALSGLIDDSEPVNQLMPEQDTSTSTRAPFMSAIKKRTIDDELRKALLGMTDDNGLPRFVNKSLDWTLRSYYSQLVRRGEWNRRLGDMTYAERHSKWMAGDKKTPEPKFEPNRMLEEKMAAARKWAEKQGRNIDEEQGIMLDALAAMTKQYGLISNPNVRKAMNGMKLFQNLRTLLFVTLSSFPDLANQFIFTGEFKDTFRVMHENMKAALKGELDETLAMYGYASDAFDATFMEDLASLRDGGGVAHKLNAAFFKAIGLHKWTQFTRALALKQSLHYIEKHNRLAKEGSTDSMQRLAELGLQEGDVDAWIEQDRQTKFSGSEDERVARVTAGVQHMVDSIVLHPAPAEKTLWGNSEARQLLWHLKGFMYAFSTRVLGRGLGKAWEAGLTPQGATQMAALALLLPLAAFGLALRDLLQYWLWGEESYTPYDNPLKYLMTLAGRSGITGFAQYGVDIMQASEKGRAPLLAVAGPTVTWANDLLEYSPAKVVPGSIPLIAAVPGVRNSIRDWIEQ